MGKLIIGNNPDFIWWGNDCVDHIYVGEEHVWPWPWTDADVLINIYVDGEYKESVPMTLVNGGITDTNWGFYVKHELYTSGSYAGKYWSNITYYNNDVVQYECKGWTSTADVGGSRSGTGEGMYGVFSKDDTNQVWNIYLVTDGLMTINVYVDAEKKQSFRIPIGNSNWRDESNTVASSYPTNYGCRLSTSRFVTHEEYVDALGNYKNVWIQYFRARFQYNTSGNQDYEFEKMTYGANNLTYKTVTDITSYDQIRMSQHDIDLKYWGYLDDPQINIYLHSPRIKVTVFNNGTKLPEIYIPFSAASQVYQIGSVKIDAIATGDPLNRQVTGIYNSANLAFEFDKVVWRTDERGEHEFDYQSYQWSFNSSQDHNIEVEYYIHAKTIEYKYSLNNSEWYVENKLFQTKWHYALERATTVWVNQTLNSDGSMKIQFVEDNNATVKRAIFYNGDVEVFRGSGSFTHTFSPAEMDNNLRAEIIVDEWANKIPVNLLVLANVVESTSIPTHAGDTFDVDRIFPDYPGFKIHQELTYVPETDKSMVVLTAFNDEDMQHAGEGYRVYGINVYVNGVEMSGGSTYDENFKVMFDAMEWENAKIDIYLHEN